ncbi:MAG: helix-turn-helix transcriptional regulator [Pseudomonadota bacterium]
MPDYLTTRELADLLRIKERKVYDLVAGGEVPVSRATGKLLFPRAEVDTWLRRHSIGFQAGSAIARPLVVAGSHDPLLDWALRESGAGLATYFDGSLDGLERFADGRALMAALHLHDAGSGRWSDVRVSEQFSDEPVVLLEFAWRDRGLVVGRESAGRIDSINALTGCRVVPRQPQAASQLLLEQMVSEAGVERIDWLHPARTETDAVLAVAQGQADAAFGLAGLAEQFGLAFVPLLNERFDLLVRRRDWFEAPLQRFAAFCGGPAFDRKAREMGGYQISDFGRAHFNGAER